VGDGKRGCVSGVAIGGGASESSRNVELVGLVDGGVNPSDSSRSTPHEEEVAYPPVAGVRLPEALKMTPLIQCSFQQTGKMGESEGYTSEQLIALFLFL
jgi:hypothetical protein